MEIPNCPQALGSTALQSLLLWQQTTSEFVLAHVSVLHPTELLTLVDVLFSLDQEEKAMGYLAKGCLKS